MNSKFLNTFYLVLLLSLFLFPEKSMGKEKAKEKPLGITFGLDYMSNYLWRGGYWYNNDGAFFPYLSYEIAGLTASYCGEFSEDALIDDGDDSIKDLHATDFGLDYSHDLFEVVSLGTSLWYFYFHNKDENSFGTGSISLSLISLPLTPTLTYNHDYYTDDAADEQGKDFYIQLGVGDSLSITKEASLDLGLVGSYYRVKSWGNDQKGISDLTASAGINLSFNQITLTGSFNYCLVPSKDFYGDPKDRHRFYSKFGVSYLL